MNIFRDQFEVIKLLSEVMMTLLMCGFFTPIAKHIHIDINLCNDFNKSCTVEVVLYDFDTLLVGNKNSNDEEVNG